MQPMVIVLHFTNKRSAWSAVDAGKRAGFAARGYDNPQGGYDCELRVRSVPRSAQFKQLLATAFEIAHKIGGEYGACSVGGGFVSY